MLLQLKRERETKAMSMVAGVPWETVTLTTLSRDRRLFPVLLAEARHCALKGQEGKLVINTAWGTSWKPFGKPRPKRPLDSVVLQEGVAERITSDVKTFLQRRRWYANRGMYIVATLGHYTDLVKVSRIDGVISYTALPDQENRLSYRPLRGRSLMTYAFLICPNEGWPMINSIISYPTLQSAALYSSKTWMQRLISVCRPARMGELCMSHPFHQSWFMSTLDINHQSPSLVF